MTDPYLWQGWAEVQKDLNYIIRGQTYGGAYIKCSPNAAAFRGVIP